MKRPLSIIVSSAVFTSVIAGAVTFSMLKLMQPKGGISTAAAPSKEVVSTSSKPSATMVGTDHPVPVSPPLQSAASPKPIVSNSPATPVPQASALVENDSHHQAESPSDNTSGHEAESLADNSSSREAESPAELGRERAEQARENAEHFRARVEDLYQAHRISETAYKQGQAQYQHELAKYEDQIAKLRANTGTGATDE
jgi:type IV secretory pathway VirB10-like protein